MEYVHTYLYIFHFPCPVECECTTKSDMLHRVWSYPHVTLCALQGQMSANLCSAVEQKLMKLNTKVTVKENYSGHIYKPFRV